MTDQIALPQLADRNPTRRATFILAKAEVILYGNRNQFKAF